jgi:hypothetical protein
MTTRSSIKVKPARVRCLTRKSLLKIEKWRSE